MQEWWDAMSQIEHVYWIIALISALLFIVVLIATFLGGDTDTDGDGFDADGMDFQFFTFKNMVGFFTLFAFSGIACINSGYSNTVTIIVSLLCGTIMMTLMAFLFRFISKQAESGTLRVSNAVGQIGEVYITVGKDRSTIGKIQIKVQGTLRELEAITDEDFDLVQGNVIKVLEVISGELLLIEKLKK